MLTVAYLANQFPSPVEPYVGDEIEELRRRGVRVVAGSVRRTGDSADPRSSPTLVLQPLRVAVLLRAAWLCVRRWSQISDLIGRALWRGREGPVARVKALLHTWLGACYAVMLADGKIDHVHVQHIHVHHGYFGSWIAMVAARLLNVGCSMTLHGSDLLRHAIYVDVKLENCSFFRPVSEYIGGYILDHYPEGQASRVIVSP